MPSTRIQRHIRAPRPAVYRALLDRDAIADWMVPEGMRCTIHEFDARVGGTFRVSLSYEAPTGRGKTSAQTDTYHGRFVELVPDERVVRRIEFETSDPGMLGEMTLGIHLGDAGDGTDLLVVHDDLPPALAPADNELGWQLSLAKLSALLEG